METDMVICTRRIEWDSGHRVLGHGGKCCFLHGHRYAAKITVAADNLDSLGMVVDFSVIKKEVGGWIDENWDHNILLNSKDPLAVQSESKISGGTLDGCSIWQSQVGIFAGRKPFIFENINPTAEVIAERLFHETRRLLAPYKIRANMVEVYETPNCSAVFTAIQASEKAVTAKGS